MTDPSVPLSEEELTALEDGSLSAYLEKDTIIRLVAMARRSLEPRVRIRPRPLPPLIIPEETPNAES